MNKKINEMTDEELDAAIAQLRETRIPGPALEKKSRKPRRLDDPEKPKKKSWRDELFGDE
jgi:hypothetical protein